MVGSENGILRGRLVLTKSLRCGDSFGVNVWPTSAVDQLTVTMTRLIGDTVGPDSTACAFTAFWDGLRLPTGFYRNHP